MDCLAVSQVICSICQERLIEGDGEDVEILSTVCGHVYHRACLASWFQQKEPQRRVQRVNPDELLRGECPNCFKPQWLKRCIRVYLSCEDADTSQVRNLFDQMEAELTDTKQQLTSSKLELADTKKQLSQAEVIIKQQAALLDKVKATSVKDPPEIKNNVATKRGRGAPASTAASSASAAGTGSKTKTSTSRAVVAKSTVKTAAASKVKTTPAPLSPSAAKIRKHQTLIATLANDSDISSVASSGSFYSPPPTLKPRAPIVRKPVMTRARTRSTTAEAAANATSSQVTLGSRTGASRLRTGVVGNPISSHR